MDLVVERGTFGCLYGASGSGKSTLLALIGGILAADQGEVVVDGDDVSGLTENARADLRLRRIAVIFQGDNLLPELSAAENVMLPRLARGLKAKAARDEALEALDTVGIGQLADRRPGQMSGGQRQRVGIARALVGERSVLLADEPTGALDSANSRSLFQLIARLCESRQLTALVATHDPLAREVAARVWQMTDGRVTTE